MTFILNNKILIYILPFFIGCLSSFSLPPYNFLILNFLIFPILLLFLIYNQKKKWNSFKIGWCFGFGYFISNIYWITNSLTFYETFKPLIPIALLVIPLFLGTFYGFGTLACSLFKLKKNFYTILIFAVIFSLIEFLRGFILGGFPWNLIAYSWTNYLNSIQIISFIGTYSFNLISITIFLLPIVIFFDKKLNFKISILLLLFLVLISNHYYGYYKINKGHKLNTKINDFKIKLVSPKISIKKFFEPNNELTLIKELIELSDPNTSDKTVFIFPEGALAGVNLKRLKNFKNNFAEKFSDKHTIIMGIIKYIIQWSY